MNNRDWKNARNILCVRLDNGGDVLMTTPAIRAIKNSQPQRRITLLTSNAGAAMARHIPEIDAVIRCEAPWVKNAAAQRPTAVLELRDDIAARQFDAAIIFTVYSQTPLPAAMLCFLAGIPLRLAHCRENPYHLLTEWVRETEP